MWWTEVRWNGLDEDQAEGLACVVCAHSYLSPGARASVPAGWSETHSQVFACVGACARVAARRAGSLVAGERVNHG